MAALLTLGDPGPDAILPVRFYGRAEHARDGAGFRVRWWTPQDVWGDGLRHPDRRYSATAPSTPCG